MRLAVAPLVALAAGCGAFYHVDDTVGSDGAVVADTPRPPDAPLPADAPLQPDAITGSACTPNLADKGLDMLAIGASYYVAYGSQAMWFETNQIVAGSIGGGHSTAFMSPSPTTPRLEPDGMHALVTLDGQVFEASLESGQWGALAAQTGLVGTPGTTAASRDRTVADVGGGRFQEYLRTDGSNLWATTASSFTLGSDAHDPELSRNALRLVFAAKTNGLADDIYYVDRASPTGEFSSTPMLLYPAAVGSGGSAMTPFLSDDCETLTYNDGTDLVLVSATSI